MGRTFLLLLLLVTTIFGCQAVPVVGPIVSGYISWVDGEARAYFEADVETTYQATKRALAHFDYPINSEERSDSGYQLKAASENRFSIKIQKVEKYVTRVNIRVNFMGDKPHAEMIYKRLAKELDIIDFETKSRKRRLGKVFSS